MNTTAITARKKPVTIQAIKWTGDNLRQVITFTDGPPETRSMHAAMKWEEYEDLVKREGLIIFTLEDGLDRKAKHYASVGDYIIRGVKGEFYACKPDIFEMTYDVVDNTQASQQVPSGMTVPLPKLSEELQNRFNVMSAQWHEEAVKQYAKDYARAILAAATPGQEAIPTDAKEQWLSAQTPFFLNMVRNAAREEAAVICKQADASAQIYRTEREKAGDNGRAKYWMGYSDGAAICARAILALKSASVSEQKGDV